MFEAILKKEGGLESSFGGDSREGYSSQPESNKSCPDIPSRPKLELALYAILNCNVNESIFAATS
jgi:hypothetical protein